MNSAVVFDKTEFFNGLLMVCASGIGDALDIPEVWPDAAFFAQSRNVLVIDFKTLAHDDLDHHARVLLVKHIQDTSQHKFMLACTLETPQKKLYVGDTVKNKFKTIAVPKTKTRLKLYCQDTTPLTILIDVLGEHDDV